MQATSKKGRSAYTTIYQAMRSERSEWEEEWKRISDYLLPGRGIYQLYSKPRKRKLTSPRVVNSHAGDALNVLTSGLQGGLTSPSRKWFTLEWFDARLNQVDELKAWIQEAETRVHRGLHISNFYPVIHSFYTEYCGFGNGSMFVGEGDLTTPYNFELLTAGEYAFTVGGNGQVDTLYRSLFLSPRQCYERWGNKCSDYIKRAVKKNQGEKEKRYVTILECVVPEPFMGMPFKRYYWELQSSSLGGGDNAPIPSDTSKPLEVRGFHEFPYPVGRFDIIGSDVYGVGPGSRALPDIQRLQEMEKAFLMAAHKSVNPPLFAPAKLRGKLNTLPGGYNYYSNPSEKITSIYDQRIDFTSIGTAIERTTQRIDRNFFNDIFLTASRDPNASPLKATEANIRDQEKMLRLGPVIERLMKEFLQPTIIRCFNISQRRGDFPPLSDALKQMVADAGGYRVNLVSPLAHAQKQIALQGINTFLGFVAQGANFDQRILDKVNIDRTADEVADISGVSRTILNTDDEVQQIREGRAAAQQAQAQKEEQAMNQAHASQMSGEQATAQKTQAEAGVAMLEGQEKAQGMGIQ